MRRQNQETEYSGERGWFIKLILRTGWIVLIAMVSWYLTQWLLFDAELLSIEAMYRGGFPRTLSEEVLTYILAAAVFIIVNIFIMIGYFFALPSGRRRADRPTTYTRKPDYH